MTQKQTSNWTLVHNGAPLKLLSQQIPDPQGEQVLLRVTHCGVCHSDLYFQDGFYDLGAGKKLSLADRGIKLPMVPGHETVGTVVAMGPDARGVSVGDRGIAFPWAGCGQCSRCRTGSEHLCFKPQTLGVFRNGGYGTHVLLQRPEHLIDFDGVDPALAATFACSGITAYSAVKKLLPLSPEEAVVIFGAGGLGLAAVSIIGALSPTTPTIVVDISQERLDLATQAGAVATLLGPSRDLVQQIQSRAGRPVGGVVDFVGSTGTAEPGIEVLSKGGKYVLVGLYGGSVELQLPLLPLRAISVLGSYVGSLSELKELVHLAKTGALKPTPVERVPHADPNTALERLRSGQVLGRLVLTTEA